MAVSEPAAGARAATSEREPEGARVSYFDAQGNQDDGFELPGEIFAAPVNVSVMHAVVRSQLAAARSGSHSTKTRAEVRGGGAKPWRQKGTGRARHGSIREPQWVGGGIAHGPKPKDYSMRINKKEKALALASALTLRARDRRVVVVDLPAFERPETRRAKGLLDLWDASGRVLIVLGDDQELPDEVWKSFRNLPQVLAVRHPTAAMVLAADTVVVTKDALGSLRKGTEAPAAKVAAPAASPPETEGSESA